MRRLLKRTVFLYFILLAGALWHIAGLFGSFMRASAGWLMIALGAWVLLEFLIVRKEERAKNNQRRELFLWGLGVITLTWLVECLGMRSGLIFGQYQYGAALQPQIGGVPLAIGFAWLTMLLSAAALERRLPFRPDAENHLFRSMRIALLMLFFDVVMEPIAVKLNYWSWQRSVIPWKNYLAWMLISMALAYTTLRLKVLKNRLPKIAAHFYLVQMIYFGLIYLA